MDLVITERVNESDKHKDLRDKFYLPLPYLEQLARLKKGFVVPKIGKDDVKYSMAGCDINVGGNILDISKMSRNDSDLLTVIRSNSTYPDPTCEWHGVIWKIKKIPDAVEYVIENDGNNTEAIFFKNKKDEELRPAFVFQDLEEEPVQMPDVVIDGYVKKKPEGKLTRIFTIDKGKKVGTQFLNLDKKKMIHVYEISRQAPCLVKTIQENIEEVGDKVRIVRISGTPIILPSDTNKNFEILVPDVNK